MSMDSQGDVRNYLPRIGVGHTLIDAGHRGLLCTYVNHTAAGQASAEYGRIRFLDGNLKPTFTKDWKADLMYGNFLEAHDRKKQIGHFLHVSSVTVIRNDEDDRIFLYTSVHPYNIR